MGRQGVGDGERCTCETELDHESKIFEPRSWAVAASFAASFAIALAFVIRSPHPSIVPTATLVGAKIG